VSDHFSRNNLPLIIGHRGASAIAPENTLMAFSRAMADGADGIEFDVRLARDDTAVVIHDATLQRTALRSGEVAKLSSAELKSIDVGTWFNLRYPAKACTEYSQATIPALQEVFESLDKSGALFYVEMKYEPQDSYKTLARQVAQLVLDYSLTKQVVVESFALESIAEIKRLNPLIRTAALFERTLSRPAPSLRHIVAQAVRCGANELALHRTFPLQRATQEAALHNLKTVIWTVDAPAWALRAARYGVHALITNNPARLCAERTRIHRASNSTRSIPTVDL